MDLILEGGAAVSGRPILQSEVPSIVEKIDEILSGLGLVQGEDWNMVGSAGKKKAEDTSGDIDICIKRDRMRDALGCGDDKNIILNELAKYIEGLGYTKYAIASAFYQVSFAMPINGEDDVVQIDLILTRSLEWSNFTQASPDYRKDESKYKAHVRNVLMMCIVKYCFKRTTKRVTLDDDTIVDGEVETYAIRLQDGLYQTRKNWFGKREGSMVKNPNRMKEYDKLITDAPQEFIDLIFEDGSVNDFVSFETLYDAFMSDRFKFPENREKILVGYVMSLDGQDIDVPSEVPQQYVDEAREKERLAAEKEEYNKVNKIKRKIKHIETFEGFVNRDAEDILNEGVVVKKARGGMKVVKEDGTESVLPSITKVLSAMEDSDWYEKWVAKIGKEAAKSISQAAAHRGTMMHNLLDWYFSGKVDIEELRMELDSRFPSFTEDEKNIAFNLFSVLYNGGVFNGIKDVDSIEKSIYSLENGGFWGKTDFVAVKENGRKIIVDFKSSKSVHTKDYKVDKYKLQLAGYWIAWRETMGETLDGCELWIAHEDHDTPDVIELHGSELRTKCDEFLNMVTMWHEQFAQPVETVLGINEMKNIIPFDKFLTQCKSSCQNYTKAISLSEGVERNTTNTPEDIDYVELNIYDDLIYVDGYIKKQVGGYSKHPLAVALYIPPTLWSSLGMTYDKWATQMLDDAEIRELQKSKINIDNPPSGFFELIGFERNRNIMWLNIDDEDIPFPAYLHKQLFERGGELFRVPPTDRKAQEYIKVLRIGNFN